jgi:NLR family CARD domain-containing protein 3
MFLFYSWLVSSMRASRMFPFRSHAKQARQLRRLGQNDQSLTELDLTNEPMTRESILELTVNLTRNTALQYLWLENVNLADNSLMAALANALADNTTLKSLSLARNGIGDIGIVALAEALRHNQSLSALSLWGNQISDQGIFAFAEMLTQNRSLTVIWLSQNAISDRGVHALAAALRSNPIIAKLYVEGNVGVSETALAILDEILSDRAIGSVDGIESDGEERNDEEMQPLTRLC